MNLLALVRLSEHVVKAIGTTLIHSLWQGLILVGVTGLIILTTRLQKPALRYKLLVSSLAVFFIVNVTTFVNACLSSPQNKLTSNLVNVGKENFTSFLPDVTLLVQAKAYLADHNQTVVLIWFLIVLTRLFQLCIGLNGLSYLRKNTKPISSYWENTTQILAQKLGVNDVVHIAECALIRVPMVIGHLKPLILLPLGLLTALPPKEIEAILVHELAHVYRRDYLVNLMQSVMEILFFFNPAVRWLSGLIKAERENCCDDVAISLTNSKVNYISALIACQEYQKAAPAYAMALGKKGQLKNRVYRLIHNNNHSLNGLEKSILIGSLVTASLIWLAFTSEVKIEKMVKQTTSGITSAMVEMQDQLSSSDDSYSLTFTSLDTINEIEENPEIKFSSKTNVNHEELSHIDSIHQQLAITNESILDSLKALNSKWKTNAEHPRLARLDSILAPLSKKTSRSAYKNQTKNDAVQQQNNTAKPSLGEQVKEELITDGIIAKSQSKTSFMLSEKEMIVNGKRQPQEVYQKYREKYVPVVGKNSWTLYYNYDTFTETTTS